MLNNLPYTVYWTHFITEYIHSSQGKKNHCCQQPINFQQLFSTTVFAKSSLLLIIQPLEMCNYWYRIQGEEVSVVHIQAYSSSSVISRNLQWFLLQFCPCHFQFFLLSIPSSLSFISSNPDLPFSLLTLNVLLALFITSTSLTVLIIFVLVLLGKLRDRSQSTIFLNSVKTSAFKFYVKHFVIDYLKDAIQIQFILQFRSNPQGHSSGDTVNVASSATRLILAAVFYIRNNTQKMQNMHKTLFGRCF